MAYIGRAAHRFGLGIATVLILKELPDAFWHALDVCQCGDADALLVDVQREARRYLDPAAIAH